jgi:uncharacterized protein YjbI with pentapeptide repeats
MSLDEWGLPARPVVTDSGYGDCTLFRLGLAERDLSYVVQVDPSATAQPAHAVPVTAAYLGRGRPPKPAYPDPPATFTDLILAAGRDRVRKLTWRQGTRVTAGNRQAKLRSHRSSLHTVEISARIGRNRPPPPPGERLFLHDVDLADADFSGRRLKQLSTASAVFRNCRFDRMRVDVASLGLWASGALFVGCSFDHSKMYLAGSGTARFENCSFREVDFRRWTSDSVEMIECVFTGKLREVVFQGTILDQKLAERLGRDRNVFLGNDFSALTAFDVDFRTGIDLSQQRLPVSDDLIYMPDGKRAVAELRAEASSWPDSPARDLVETVIEVLVEDLEDGQRQLLLHAPTWTKRARKADAQRVIETLRRLSQPDVKR